MLKRLRSHTTRPKLLISVFASAVLAGVALMVIGPFSSAGATGPAAFGVMFDANGGSNTESFATAVRQQAMADPNEVPTMMRVLKGMAANVADGRNVDVPGATGFAQERTRIAAAQDALRNLGTGTNTDGATVTGSVTNTGTGTIPTTTTATHTSTAESSTASLKTRKAETAAPDASDSADRPSMRARNTPHVALAAKTRKCADDPSNLGGGPDGPIQGESDKSGLTWSYVNGHGKAGLGLDWQNCSFTGCKVVANLRATGLVSPSPATSRFTVNLTTYLNRGTFKGIHFEGAVYCGENQAYCGCANSRNFGKRAKDEFDVHSFRTLYRNHISFALEIWAYTPDSQWKGFPVMTPLALCPARPNTACKWPPNLKIQQTNFG